MKLTKAEQLISEAVFCELNNKQWSKGLWDSLTPYIPEITTTFKDSLKYSAKYPGSPDAYARWKALARVLDSVSESYKSMDILMERAK